MSPTPPLYLKVRHGGRIVSVAVITAVGINADGRREVLGMEIGVGGRGDLDGVPRQADSRGLPGAKLVVSDANEGLKAAATKVLSAAWQRGWPARQRRGETWWALPTTAGGPGMAGSW